MSDPQTPHDPLDSIDYCIAFWEGVHDDEEDARQVVMETQPRHVRAFDDLA